MRILDLNLNDAEAVTKEIATAGDSASAHSCDVSDQKQVISTFDHLAKQSRINILVNNAGISRSETSKLRPKMRSTASSAST